MDGKLVMRLFLFVIGLSLHGQILLPITFGALPMDGTPTFSPVAGVYSTTQTVTISTTTSGATKCYTTDGSTPSAVLGTCTHGTTYSGTVSISATATLKAIASKVGTANSAVATGVYTITSLGTTTNNQTCTPSGSTSQPQCTSRATPSVGQTILVGMLATGSRTVSSCTDDQSPPNTYSAVLASGALNTTVHAYLYAAYVATAAGVVKVTCTQSSTFSAAHMEVAVVTGITNPVNVDKAAAAVYAGNVSACSPTATGTTTNSADLIVGFLQYGNTASTAVAGSGYSIPTNGAGGTDPFGIETQVVASTGSYTPNWTLTGGNQNMYCWGAAIW